MESVIFNLFIVGVLYITEELKKLGAIADHEIDEVIVILDEKGCIFDS